MRRIDAQPTVIILTAKGDEIDRIVCLEMGADDYLPKPFNPRELVARVHAVLRRRADGIERREPGDRLRRHRSRSGDTRSNGATNSCR